MRHKCVQAVVGLTPETQNAAIKLRTQNIQDGVTSCLTSKNRLKHINSTQGVKLHFELRFQKNTHAIKHSLFM